MFYNMVFGRYVSALLLTSFQDSLHYYKTPALDNQFSNFEITTAIPSDGANGTGEAQDALNLNLNIASWPYARRYFTFNFKGKGNAQLWILNSDETKQFKVEIGGGANHNQVYVIDNKNNCFSTTVNNITSEKEYRSFWIRGRWPKHPLGVYYRVFVGLGSDPHNNTLLRTEAIDESIMNMSIIRLSTSSDNSGEWQFSSAGRTLGGCGDAIPCIDEDTQCCGVNLTCGQWVRLRNRMKGTCIPPSDFFPSLVFGDGKYPTACGIGEEVCGLEDDCSSNTCKAMTNTVKEVCDSGEVCRDNICQATPAMTTVKWTTKSMATTTPTSTPSTTTQTTTAMLTQTTTRSTTSIAIATIVQNPKSTPITTLPNTTLTLNTNIANISFNHTVHSNASTTTGSVLTNSTSIPFTTLTPTTTTGTTKSNSNITTPCTTSTTGIPLPGIISTSTTKTPPTISIPFTYTLTIKPISTTINPPDSMFGTTSTIHSPNPTVPTTTTATTTYTQTTVPGLITSAITLTTNTSTTSKKAHTTTTVPSTHMQTTILKVPLSSTQHVTELNMCESSISSGCLVVQTDRTFPSTRSSSFLYTNRWAILAGTAGGLIFIGAATWILFSHAVQYKRNLLHRRRVFPSRTQTPENDNGNNIICA